jgi:hypothetical protein
VSLWAVIDTDASVERSSGGVAGTQSGTGLYNVDFNTNISQCAYTATIGSAGTSAPNRGFLHVYLRSGFTDQVRVETFDAVHPSGGNPSDRPFHLTVTC